MFKHHISEKDDDDNEEVEEAPEEKEVVMVAKVKPKKLTKAEKKKVKQKGLSKDDLHVFETDFRQFISKD